MIKYLLLISLFLSTFSTKAQLIDSKELYKPNNYSQFAMSSDAKNITYIQLRKDDYGLFNYNIETKDSTLIKKIASSYTIDEHFWLGDNLLYFKLKYRKKESQYLALLKDNKFKFKRLNKNTNLITGYELKNNQLLFAKDAKKKRSEVFLIDVESIFADKVEENKSPLFLTKLNRHSLFFDTNSQKLIGFKINESLISMLSMPLDGSKWLPIIEINLDNEHVFSPIGFLDDENLAVLSNEYSDTVSVYKYNIKSKDLTELLYSNEQYDVYSAGLSNGSVSFVNYFKKGVLFKEYINTNELTLNNKLYSELEGKTISVLDVDETATHYLLYASSSTDLGQWLYYNANSESLIQLAHANDAIEEIAFAPTEIINTTSVDGLEIEAMLTKPITNDRKTLIVMPHGGPIGVRDYNLFDHEIQLLANRGFSVLRVNFRGSSGFGKTFQNKGVGALGDGIESDILAAIAKVQETTQFEHMCAIGRSYGGYSSAMLAIRHPKMFNCVVGAYGIYDVPLLFSSSNYFGIDTVRSKIEKVVGSINESDTKPSPVYLASKINTPVMLIAGKKDMVAHFEHTNRFKYVLKQNNKDYETLFFKKLKHGQTTWYGYRQETLAIIDFLERKLNLKKLTANSKLEKSILAHESATLSDLYSSQGPLLEKNDTFTIRHLEDAATLEHPRSIFNLGAHYHRGDGVSRNLKKALTYYEKSAALGYKEGQIRVARMYFQGEGVEKNIKLAQKYLTMVEDLESNDKAAALKIRMTCLSPDTSENTLLCKEMFDALAKKSGIRSRDLNIAAQIILDPNVTAQTQKILEDYFEEQLDLQAVSFSYNLEEEGSFERQSRVQLWKPYKYEKVELTNSLVQSNHYCRTKAELDLEGFDGKSRVAALLRWRVFSDNKEEMEFYAVKYGTTIKPWEFLTKIDKTDKPTTYQLDIFNIKADKVHSFSCDIK